MAPGGVSSVSEDTDIVIERDSEIQAELPDGAEDTLVRTVTENCRTLEFSGRGFERE